MAALPFFFALIVLLPMAHGHSFLTKPEAYNRKFQLRNCHGQECLQACPPILARNEMRNSPKYPAETWSRGQTVKVKWTRNNHVNGMVRLSIVPLNKKMSRRWHSRLAFWYGCFGQGKYRCYGDECGADQTKHAYSANIKVPSFLPDGNYVLGLVWYGGIHRPLWMKAFFSDYWSCSYIRIQGGQPLGGSYQPYFEAGDDPSAMRNGKCFTAVNAPGVCSKHGCKGPARYSFPRPFKAGRKPKKISVKDFRAAM